MWLNRLFSRKKAQQAPEATKGAEDREPTINQGVYYLYMIVGLQIAFVFVILGVIMFIGKVISTPGWVFMLMFLLFIGSMVYIWRKAKRQFQRIKESLSRTDQSNNYEISLMGGMLTMRIEQNPNAPKLLDAPASAPAEPIIDAETIEPEPGHKRAHLF